jgi:DHA2 family multidrug resistance protein
MSDTSESIRFDGSKALITVSVMLASLMAFVDISIVTVALSEMRASFGTPINQISWVSTSYMMGNVLIMPLSGWLQRRFTYRRYFTTSILIFTAASVLCGLAFNLPSLVICRALQGLGGGAIIPTAQAILFIRYPKEQHGRAAALIGLAAITGPLLGPYVGGKLIDVANWHWIFLINLPIGALAAWLSHANLRQPETERPREKVDWYGIALLAVGLLSLQYVLEEGTREGWFDSVLIVALATVSAIALCTFIVHELETEHPVLALNLFRSASYSAATAINFLIGVSVFAGSFIFSLYMGSVLRRSALDIGRVFLRGNAVLLLLMPLMGRIVGNVSGRLLIGVGVALMSLSLWMNGHLTPAADTHTLVMPLVVRAFAIALTFTPLMPYALSDVEPLQRGNAAALFNLTRELGGSIGIAWMTTLLDRGLHEHISSLSQYIDPFNPAAAVELGGIRPYLTAAGAWDPERAAMALAHLRVTRQALSLAFNYDFLALALVFVVALLLLVFLRSSRRPILSIKVGD